MKLQKEQEELKGLSPFLHEMRQSDDGFKLPEGYLDHFENELFSKLDTSGRQVKPGMQVVKKPVNKTRPLWSLMAIAATFALLVSAVWFFQSRPAVINNPDVASVELSEEDIEAYLLENVYEFEAEQLALLPEPEATASPANEQPSPGKTNSTELTPEDVEHILDDMTEEELEEIL